MIESFGLVVLLAGLPVSEAAKSAGLLLSVIGFAGRRLSGEPFPEWRHAPSIALAAFYLVAVASVLAQSPGARRPEALLSLALTVVAFPIVLDALHRDGQRATAAGGGTDALFL